jgi:transcriptional regulator with XRE-family HTH domain
VRRLTGWSQTTLGGVIGLDQATISAIERGEHQLRNIDDVAGLARGLAIPPTRLNFPDIRATVGVRGDAGRKDVSWVDRRDFGEHIAGLILGIAGTAGLDTDRLLALLPQAEPTSTRQVGVADVEVVEQLTAAFRSQDFAYGSGLVRDAAVAQVHVVLPLLDARIPAEMQPRLQLAAADLAAQAGWMSFDTTEHDAARRLWMIGLDLARHAEHPRSTDLTVYLLADMTLQSVHLGRPKEALYLARVGHTAAVGRHPVSASATCLLRNIQAQAYAADGDTAGCDRACGQALEHFGSINPAASPPWTAYIGKNGAGPGGGQGSAHYTLALPGRDSRAAARAVPLLHEAVDHYGPGYAQLRARYLPDLSGAHALAGDIDTAVTVGHEAINAVTVVSDFVARDQLHLLNTVLEPLHTSPGVTELRDRLTTITAA